ncbi:hypothetical protein ES702_03051 [subsurface metagenome]
MEKGVDVALATDLIGMAWEDAYNVAVIVSGDEDYAGAVGKVMSKGRNVEFASFRKNLSRGLKNAALTKLNAQPRHADHYITILPKVIHTFLVKSQTAPMIATLNPSL